MIVIIPAYEPGEVLIDVVKGVREQTDYKVIVVNDGSSASKCHIFDKVEQLGAVLLHHECNKGKGSAIKTALKYVGDTQKEATHVVIADADGQHKIEDIKKVCASALGSDGMVIGSRQFTGKVPFRSKFGNVVTKYVFSLSAGKKISDTQTGLRAFAVSLIPFMLSIEGERYEYEMNVLLYTAKKGIEIIEVPIETVYEGNNESSHFRPIVDSIKIYKQILKFSCASFVSFIIDFILYSLFLLILNTSVEETATAILISNVVARLISATANYWMNKKFVFKHEGKVVQSALKYALLATFILVVNTRLLTWLYEYIIKNKFVAKIVTELVLFMFSWIIQKKVVFRMRKDGE